MNRRELFPFGSMAYCFGYLHMASAQSSLTQMRWDGRGFVERFSLDRGGSWGILAPPFKIRIVT